MWPNPQFPADLVTFTEEILNGKHFLCSVCLNVFQGEFLNLPAFAILNTTSESFREYEP